MSLLDEFLSWLEKRHPEVLPLTLATGRWVEKYLDLGFIPRDKMCTRQQYIDMITPLVGEFKRERCGLAGG